MKKAVFAFSALAIAALAAPAAHAQGVRLGFRAGANYSNLAGEVQNESIYNNKIGFMGGVILNADLTGDGFFSVQPEILYSQKGFENKPTTYTSTLFGAGYEVKREGKVNYNYLDVPVLAKFNADGFVFEAGPQYSYLLSSSNESKLSRRTLPNGTFQEVRETEDQNDVSGLKRSELGYVAGVGYQTESGLGFGLRYTGAFSDFVKPENGTYFQGDLKNARHSAFQLSVNYLFAGK
ncbi:porin family protein [Hymenobacter latericus]|uniref:porin family protein n=1 Tax=Hymenobacter sp. YIM 151858-1 TaxID=2987688 RepID=UPI002227B9CF|nr:porin family protein [Hymenobacter sp. YIM 151858-1]UYZ58798.1 PorT family protein [Hymenobacter sp. YIM 151858-1]